ncbi:Mannose-6-phosphate isomerase [Eumeta japonica]|uniref:Phosphohexomutase n=1 Tax=Eumeta variegata TaxID=151549 RepID=A0A4C1WBW4_EUMVA|nr:Mannose-6-phosphate isomerase [Eumeta japonica]
MDHRGLPTIPPPAEEHAEKLHKNFPDIYKDPNHKPELAIALTPFEALCGFRPLSEVKEFLQRVPELTEMLSEESVQAVLSLNEQGDNAKAALKKLFCSLMTTDKEVIAKNLQNLLARLKIQGDYFMTYIRKCYYFRLHRVRPDGTCECRRRVTCAMDDAWWKSSRHRMSQETVTGRFPSLLPAGGGYGRVE